MKTQVSFRSPSFPAEEGEQEQINPGVWGRRLAVHLAAGLASRGLEAGEPIAEDWGYYIPIINDGFPLAVCCGHQDGDDDEFLCFTEPATPKVKKLFRTIDATAQLTTVLAALRDILESDPNVREIVWSDITA